VDDGPSNPEETMNAYSGISIPARIGWKPGEKGCRLNSAAGSLKKRSERR
jgi:hypothetical protein